MRDGDHLRARDLEGHPGFVLELTLAFGGAAACALDPGRVAEGELAGEFHQVARGGYRAQDVADREAALGWGDDPGLTIRRNERLVVVERRVEDRGLERRGRELHHRRTLHFLAGHALHIVVLEDEIGDRLAIARAAETSVKAGRAL